ncbi:sugar transporter ERD6-like isoform X2 [Bombus impatiens]|uniref:Sugar transporter ERD6-like isoform X2 n=1 Tax=Bombus impatiens TaxID=132113 RepID=A0A6P8LE45_BOMIM|nr:sugar transporter ERD6-like isoform X2 [Bombus impatiens]
MHQPSTSEIHSEPTSEIHQPSRSEIRVSSASEIYRPSTSEIRRPSTSEIDRPSTSEIHRPSTRKIHRPSTSGKHSQSTSELHRPSTSEIHRPSTSQIHRPSTCELYSQSTSELHRSSTSEIYRPSTSQIHRQSTSHIHRPPTSQIHRSSTSQIHRPSTSQLHPETISEIHQSSTSEIHQRSTSEIHPGPTSEIHPGTRSELQSRSRSDLRTEFNVDSQGSTDSDETYMDGTEYTCMTKLQVILHRNYRKALYIMLGLTMAQQLSGNFITTQHLEVLLRKTTIVIDPHEATILVLFVSFVSGSLISFALQFVGRRTLLLLSTGGTSITLIILAIYLVLFGNLLEASNVSIIPVIDLIIYQVLFEIGLGTLPNVLLCDLFPAELRGFVSVINVTFDAIIGLIVMVLYKVFVDNLGSYTIYFIFATSCFLAFLMVFIWVPETKGKTYNEIEALLAGENLNSLNEEVRTDEMDVRRI